MQTIGTSGHSQEYPITASDLSSPILPPPSMRALVMLALAGVAHAAHLVLPFYSSVFVDGTFTYHGAHEYMYLVTNVLVGSNQQQIEAAISFSDPQSVIYELYSCHTMGIYSARTPGGECSTGLLPPFASNESTSYAVVTNASWSTQVRMQGFGAWEGVTWASDTFVLANETLDDVVFLVPTNGMANVGDFNRLGLGVEHPGYNVSSNGVSEKFLHAFGSPLVYSVYNNPFGTTSGSVVVGGVDHAKYSDPLVYLAPDAAEGFYGVSFGGSSVWRSGNSSDPLSFNPDQPFSILPSAVINAVTKHYGWTCVNNFCGGLCEAVDNSTLGLVLGNLTVEIPVSNLVMAPPSGLNMTCALTSLDASDGGLLYAGPSEFLLGADILQYLYVVKYPEDGATAIAVANWNVTETDVEEVEESVPGVVSFTQPTTVLVAKLLAIKAYNFPAYTAAPSTSDEHKSHSNTGKIVGGVVGGVGGAIVVAAVLFFVWRRRSLAAAPLALDVESSTSKAAGDVET